MGISHQANQRLSAAIKEIERLKQSEFPYAHPREALELLEKRFRGHQSLIEKSPPLLLATACKNSLRDLFLYLPFLGFLLRSTNVRNSFEAYDPLLGLARTLLGEDTKLIISSEWEFSPYTYKPIPGLKDFVLIGLPATESSNPMLLPSAGHELGHSVWDSKGFSSVLEDKIKRAVLEEVRERRWNEYEGIYPHTKKDELNDLFAKHTWAPAVDWALLQSEEMFCDFFGLRLFAESYLHAFAYLVSPGRSGTRSLRYPNTQKRVRHFLAAANALGVVAPAGYVDQFEDEAEPNDPRLMFLVSVADTVSGNLLQELIALVEQVSTEIVLPTRSSSNVAKISQLFQSQVVPAKEAYPLTDLLNACWVSALQEDLWKDRQQILPEDRERILKDLVLKSIEVAEINEKWRQAP